MTRKIVVSKHPYPQFSVVSLSNHSSHMTLNFDDGSHLAVMFSSYNVTPTSSLKNKILSTSRQNKSNIIKT